MAGSDFLLFANAATNIESQSDYLADATVSAGRSSGIVPSASYNKTLRQATAGAAVLGAFISAQGGTALDNGSLSGLLTAFNSALTSYIGTTGLLKANNLSDLASLTTALTNLGFAKSIATSGYQKLPGGLIIQWGITSGIANNSHVTVTLPTTFPNNGLMAVATENLDAGADGASSTSISCSTLTASTLVIFNRTGVGTLQAGYISIGY